MAFALNLYPSRTDAELQSSKEIVAGEAREFARQYRAAHPTLSTDEELFLGELARYKYWGVLQLIDGYATTDTQEPTTQRNTEARKWARQRFSEGDLQKLLDIAVNVALLVPTEDSPNPGTLLGHTILYQQLVENPGSIYAGVVTPGFERRLHNGRFWESQASLQPCTGSTALPIVNDILLNHHDQLDVQFAREGIKLTRRAAYNTRPSIDLCHLPNLSTERYGEFFRRTHLEVGGAAFQEDELATFIAPWIVEMASVREDQGLRSPRFLETPEQIRAFFAEEFVRHYSSSSPYTQNRLAHMIGLTWGHGEDIGHMTDVFLALPNKKAVGRLIFAELNDSSIVNLIERVDERTIRNHLDEATNDLIMGAKNRAYAAARKLKTRRRERESY